MRFEAYLRVLSDEVTIRTLYTAVSLKGATITQLKAPNPGTDQFWWNWKTTRVVIDGYDVDAKVRALLEQNRPYFPDIKKLAGDSV